ncbi:hypothetical protein BJ085DRAFT_40307 [Dimargaris cristalligena]|uniref:Uncharacterized protein n=1 Tax=Dimargaris cristalligena TaxID=215637 RepID=A0A4P9ZV30_9FUNG|nr:hypothetical protein BJ085DRAFT_40307 [Dimargaris cristalligena]|eukprot:RKP37128.1 hypothetical protein BJ085DRAFT_40307 [Dimargaris cristalligena]
MDAITQWDLGRLAREKDVSILDRLFLINLRIMVYDSTRDIICSTPHCANPLCHSIHSPVFDTQDKASAFGCCLNLLLNDGMHHRIIDRDDKMSVRLTAISSANTTQQRVRCLREISALLLLARQSASLKQIALKGLDRLRYLAKDSSSETVNQLSNACLYGNERARLYEVPNPWMFHDLQWLDGSKLARLAQLSVSAPFLGAVYLLTSSDLEVDDMFYFCLIKYGQLHLDYWRQATTLTCPMLLHLFLTTDPKESIEFLFHENLPYLRPFFRRGPPDPRKFTPLNRVLDKALMKAHDLGITTMFQIEGHSSIASFSNTSILSNGSSSLAPSSNGHAAPLTPGYSTTSFALSEGGVGDDGGSSINDMVTQLHGFCINLVIDFSHLLSRMLFVQDDQQSPTSNSTPAGSRRSSNAQHFRPYFSDYFLLDYSQTASVTPWQEVFTHFMQAEAGKRKQQAPVPPIKSLSTPPTPSASGSNGASNTPTSTPSNAPSAAAATLNRTRHFSTTNVLLAYVTVAAEQVFHRDPLCDLELFLDLTMELLTEFRKLRPDYEAIMINRETAPLSSASFPPTANLTKSDQLSASAASISGHVGPQTTTGDAEGGHRSSASSSSSSLSGHSHPCLSSTLPNWNRRVREEIGGEFDRLYAEAGRYTTLCQQARARAQQYPRSSSRSGSCTSTSSSGTVRISSAASTPVDPSKLVGAVGGGSTTPLMFSSSTMPPPPMMSSLSKYGNGGLVSLAPSGTRPVSGQSRDALGHGDGAASHQQYQQQQVLHHYHISSDMGSPSMSGGTIPTSRNHSRSRSPSIVVSPNAAPLNGNPLNLVNYHLKSTIPIE